MRCMYCRYRLQMERIQDSQLKWILAKTVLLQVNYVSMRLDKATDRVYKTLAHVCCRWYAIIGQKDDWLAQRIKSKLIKMLLPH